MTLNRHQNRFDLYMANPRSAVCKVAVRDEAEQYIKEQAYSNIAFYPENMVMMSERDGYNHLYLYTIGGNLVKQITKGKFEVKEFLGWDQKANVFYYTSNEESPLRTAVYKIDGKGKRQNFPHGQEPTMLYSAKLELLYQHLFQCTDTDPHHFE